MHWLEEKAKSEKGWEGCIESRCKALHASHSKNDYKNDGLEHQNVPGVSVSTSEEVLFANSVQNSGAWWRPSDVIPED